MRIVIALLLVCAVPLLGGCGVYSASTGRVDVTLQRTSVRYLENMTSEPTIGVDLTDAIILAIQVDNTLKIVEEGDADTIISGKVVRYHLKEVSARESLTVDEYQVQIAVVLDMVRRSTGESIFSNRRFTGLGNYILDDPSGSSEETARQEAADEIVKDILAIVVEGW